jgi:predicted lipoprotein with Yx(FWY)xxD motif
MKRFTLLCILLCTLALPGMATAQMEGDGGLAVAEDPDLGQFLTDSEGMTLYIFSNDEMGSGVSVCNDDCAVNWPPFYVEDAALPEGVPGELTVITRDDGTEQLAYNGMPLYYWVKDAAPGDTTGHAVGDVWWVAAIGEATVGEASPVAEATPAMSMGDGNLMVAEDAELGQFLTDSNGMTLYIFSNDEMGSGISVCNDECAVNWPPYYVEDATLPEGVPGELTVITRDDGSEQLAYNGMPLYYWVNDTAPGDTTGHAVGDVWWVAEVGEPEGM